MKKRKIKLRFKLLLLACFLVYTGFSIFAQQTNINDLLSERETLNSAYKQAQTDLERLKHQSEYMNTDNYIENTARDKLGLIYENEIIFEPSE
ncbi:MAG: FtsB family cell division protein [Christensenellales bacterium]|jgi:cell division protein DivIC